MKSLSEMYAYLAEITDALASNCLKTLFTFDKT